MRIAVITIGDPTNKKGAFNATHERIKHLIVSKEVNLEVFILRYFNSRIAKLLRKSMTDDRDDFFIYEDIKYNNIWIPFTVIDHTLFQHFNHLGFIWKFYLNKYISIFEKFDLITAHSLLPAYFGLQIKNRFKTPLVVTWHGSEIHSIPHNNKAVLSFLKNNFSKIDWNFFVSRQLQLEALQIQNDIPKSSVLFNSANKDLFFKFSEKRIAEIKSRLNIHSESLNVGFVGNLVEIKNVLVLPYIFEKIQAQINNINFHIVGDGNLKKELIKSFKNRNVKVHFWGNQPPDCVADYLNVFDLVLLPSQNEGMPLIVLECLFCNTPILAAAVGGIPEILPDDFLVKKTDDFQDLFVEKCLLILKGQVKPTFKTPKQFTWNDISKTELNKYKEIVGTLH